MHHRQMAPKSNHKHHHQHHKPVNQAQNLIVCLTSFIGTLLAYFSQCIHRQSSAYFHQNWIIIYKWPAWRNSAWSLQHFFSPSFYLIIYLFKSVRRFRYSIHDGDGHFCKHVVDFDMTGRWQANTAYFIDDFFVVVFANG